METNATKIQVSQHKGKLCPETQVNQPKCKSSPSKDNPSPSSGKLSLLREKLSPLKGQLNPPKGKPIQLKCKLSRLE